MAGEIYKGEVSTETGRILCTLCRIWVLPSWWERHVVTWHDIEKAIVNDLRFT